MKTSSASITEIQAWKPEVLVAVEDPKQIEIMQSAEIVYRELKARGVRAVFDDRASREVDAPMRLNLSDRSLRGGGVELRKGSEPSLVNLEDAAEKTVEALRG